MNVIFFEVKDWERDYLTPNFPEDKLHFTSELLDEAHLPAAPASTSSKEKS